jgi:hypothetical protein
MFRFDLIKNLFTNPFTGRYGLKVSVTSWHFQVTGFILNGIIGQRQDGIARIAGAAAGRSDRRQFAKLMPDIYGPLPIPLHNRRQGRQSI